MMMSPILRVMWARLFLSYSLNLCLVFLSPHYLDSLSKIGPSLTILLSFLLLLESNSWNAGSFYKSVYFAFFGGKFELCLKVANSSDRSLISDRWDNFQVYYYFLFGLIKLVCNPLKRLAFITL